MYGRCRITWNGVSELVQIPSVNPCSPTIGSAGERQLAEHLANRAEDLGADVELDNVVDDRPNLIAKFEGERPDTIVIDVHLDTVAVGHMTDDPFDGASKMAVFTEGFGRHQGDIRRARCVISTRNDGRRPGPTVHFMEPSQKKWRLLGAATLRHAYKTMAIHRPHDHC